MSTAIVERVGSMSASITFADLEQSFNGIYGSFDNACRDISLKVEATLGVQEAYSKSARFARTLANEIIIKEETKRVATHQELENIITNDNITKNIIFSRLERIKLVEQHSRTNSFFRNILYSINLVELGRNCLTKKAYEKFSVTDETDGRKFEDFEGLFSDYPYHTFANDIYFKMKKVSLEKIKTKEFLSKALNYHLEDMIGLGDIFTHKALFNRPYAEHISFTDAFEKLYTLNVKELSAINENIGKNISKPFSANINLGDAFGKKSYFRRTLKDNINVKDARKIQFARPINEQLSFVDSYIRASGGVISNLYIREGEMTLNEFLDSSNKVSGYTKFSEFKVGEYEYKDALVRITMTASDQVRPTAQEVVMHIDIPDTDDRGTARIVDTTGATQIGFNKKYYTVPEVQVTLKSASASSGIIIPSIINITTEYFTVQLMNSNNQLVAGSISWVAKGY